MADVSITCAKPVELETQGADGRVERQALEKSLTLKKEIGNARLVSGDTVLWVGGAALSSLEGGAVRVATGKRSFVFPTPQDATGKQFLAELKAQVDGQAGLAVRRKKRKIRRQLVQGMMGFSPSNSLKSPPPTPGKRTPLGELSSPKPKPKLLDVSVASVPDAYQTLASPVASAASKSPFRSPFRKKSTPSTAASSPALRRLSSPMPLNVLEPPSPAPSPARAREWLSPIRSLRMRKGSVGSGSSDGKKSENSGGLPASTGSTTSSRRSSVGGVLNKRVRSLQLMLDEDETSTTPVKTAGEQKLPKSAQKSPFFLKKPPMKPKQGSPLLSASPVQQPTSTEGAKARSNSIDEPMLSPVVHNASIFDASFGSQSHMSGTPVPSPHGLLNLGNFCYMNAIVQALASLPDFVAGTENDDELVQLIHKQISKVGPARKSIDEIRATLDTWKSSGDAKRLVLQSTLQQLLRQVVDGSETSITPEPLKHVMGRRNAIFATHFQQDAHEFLLNLLNEYEMELADAVKSCATKIQEEVQSNTSTAVSSPKRSSLLSYFRPSQKQDTANAEATSAPKQSEVDAQHDLVGDLPPAKCFRAELFRSLTCRSCGYSRKQVETFYDFSLDLPFVNPLKSLSQHSEPAPEPVSSPSPQQPEKKCFCGLSATQIDKEFERIYCCPKSACSFIEKEPRDTTAEVRIGEPMQATPPSSQNDAPTAQDVLVSLELDNLIRKQFEPEVLELACEKCKTGKEAESGYSVKSLPPLVVLHLKRFEVDPMTGSLYKRSDPVLAPATIDFSQSISNDAPSATPSNKYVLKSVVHHLGRSIDEGHYVADICDASGRWIRRNDTHESLISEEYALQATRSQESCYMLFYVRADRVNRGDKENVPVSKRTDEENAANVNTPAPDSSLRAFL